MRCRVPQCNYPRPHLSNELPSLLAHLEPGSEGEVIVAVSSIEMLQLNAGNSVLSCRLELTTLDEMFVLDRTQTQPLINSK